jgi:hypothetical protein
MTNDVLIIAGWMGCGVATLPAMSAHFLPPTVPLHRAAETLTQQGYVLLDARSVQQALAVAPQDLAQLQPSWDHLPPDHHLKDGGQYRRRRHSCFVVEGEDVTPVPHRYHWQPLDYNALHGGMERWFEPIEPCTATAPVWSRLLQLIAGFASGLKGAQRWFIEAHQFRIDTTGGIGRPTPEGAHRDGHDVVAVFLIGRHRVKGGESRVFEAAGPNGQRFTLTEPWSLLLMDDARVIHEATPIQPLSEGELGWRDSLVITCRAGGFQGD